MRPKRLFLVVLVFNLVTILCGQILFADDSGLNTKLDRVLSNQEEILKQLEEVKKEVQIVKVRATR